MRSRVCLRREVLVDEVDLHGSVCHWCCHGITGEIVALPFRQKGDSFVCLANPFCSFPCARAYLNKEIRGFLQVRCQSMLPLLYKGMGGDIMEYPEAAPPRNALAMFGGSMTIETFRACTGSKVEVSAAPIVFVEEYTSVVPKSKQGGRLILSKDGVANIVTKTPKAHSAGKAKPTESGIMDFLCQN